jgi:uncharacterized RDD family membrane protein YckC
MNPLRKLRALLAALMLATPAADLALMAQDAPPAAPAPANEAKPQVADDSFIDPPKKPATKKPKGRRNRAGDDSIVSIGKSDSVPAGKTADELVVVMGNGTVDGEVTGDVVVIGGKLRVNGKVGGDVVNVGLGLDLGPKAEIWGDVVGVGGGVDQADGAVIHGEVVPVGIGFLPGLKGHMPAWVSLFFKECIIKLRPLSFQVSWPWGVFGALFILHFLVATLLPGASRGVEKAMSERPGATALMAFLLVPLGLFTLVLLSFTGIGPLVLIAASLVAVLIGKVAVAQLLGRRLVGLLSSLTPPPLACFLIGSLLIAMLYVTPYIGFFVWFALSLWGFSAVLIALFRRDTRSEPAHVPAPEPMRAPATMHVRTEPLVPAFAAAAPQGSPEPPPLDPGISTMSGGATAGSVPNEPRTSWARVSSQPGLDATELESLPRPGFVARFGALVLDWILIGFVAALVPHRIFFIDIDSINEALRILFAVAYYAAMIAWRGTSLGGLLFGLQVVRLDSRPLDRATALVRAFGAILSGAVFGLGWLWAFWDDDKQTWHDKFAGTVVVRMPKSKPLV